MGDDANAKCPKIGEWDHLEVFLGLKGYGKSTEMVSRAMELDAEASGTSIVVGHSLGARLPIKLPDGTPVPVVYHETIEALERGVRRDPNQFHVLVQGSADPVIQYARELSKSLRKDAYGWRWKSTTRMDGIRVPPIIVMVDEGIAIDAASRKPKEDDRWFAEWILSLRHEHIALLYAIQSPTGRNWILMEHATLFHVFRIRHRWAQEAIRAAGAEDVDVERMRKLPHYEKLVFS